MRFGRLKKIRQGIYSDEEYESDLAVISKTYPYAVFTMNNTLYYHGLTNTIYTDIPSVLTNAERNMKSEEMQRRGVWYAKLKKRPKKSKFDFGVSF